MGFNIPMKTTAPLNKNTIRSGVPCNVRQSVNRQNIGQIQNGAVTPPISRQPVQQPPQQRQPVKTTPPTQRQPIPTPPIQPRQTTTTPPPVQRQPIPTTPIPQRQSVPPRKVHPAPPADCIKLMRGQKTNVIDRNNRPLRKLRIGAGWDILDTRCELDISAFVLGADGKVINDDWFVFYGQPTSPDNTVRYVSTSLSGDDGAIDVDLERLNPAVQKIVFSITIYEAIAKRLNFGMIENVYTRMIDPITNKEILRFELTDCFSNVTAMVIGELYRYKGEWKFNAVGSGVNRDLADFCGMYGVALA